MTKRTYEIWFATGSQHLYGEETLKQVADHSSQIVNYLDASENLSVKLVYKPILTTPDQIYQLCLEANNTEDCVGIVTWMHTFSPAKMWINGLRALQKPMLHLHTQFNRDIPWGDIDMDFMNLNQSAHGDREFGFINTRLRLNRKVVVGHWKDEQVIKQIDTWARVATAKADLQGGKFARIGDNMRYVAVTEGDKVSSEIKFGFSVNGFGIEDLTAHVDAVSDANVLALVEQYESEYNLAPNLMADGEMRASLLDAARIELGLRSFLEEGEFLGFTDTFENLGTLKQLPGLAVQRLMADGYGFGGEGDWKTAALLRASKVMAKGLKGGTSFMEDYTYHFNPENPAVLGAHMLEICPSIADAKPKCEVHPLGIGGKEDPVRLVFNSPAGAGLNASLITMGDRFRLLVNTVNAVEPEADLPNLPVARVLWNPLPDMNTALKAWILAGGAHHTVYSQALTAEFMEDFADMFDIELVTIDEHTRMQSFKESLRVNDLYYQLRKEY
ncbi:L-arabinose isomerase [Sediminitomix flava]|uniref:L-arabinose isomerase n=1 Tax=Sediminitomix flava TaxID=379075 RepID=A0A315YY98_SEDFL|nr:L-arabinose isomerase [Sediminitomix flava]PWJ35027.1 L-arabinose isomerase [Sediminitomix flava]